MARVDTWMPIYWGDYAKDTGHLGAVHHGAYLMLIKHYWVTGEALPADDAQLWRIACMDSRAQWEKVKPIVLAFFEKRDARLVHERIEHELAKAEGNAERRAELARRAADARWQGKRQRNQRAEDAPRMPDALPGGCPPPSPSSSDNPHGKTITDAPRASASPDGPPRTGLTTEAEWQQRVEGYNPSEIRKTWKPAWGPTPDSPATTKLIPAHLVQWWKAQRAHQRTGAAA